MNKRKLFLAGAMSVGCCLPAGRAMAQGAPMQPIPAAPTVVVPAVPEPMPEAPVEAPAPAAPTAPVVPIDARTVLFYNAGGGATAITGSWGNGTFSPSRTTQYEGADTLEVTTKSFGEGVRFDLPAPVDLEPYRASGFVRVRVRFHDVAGAAQPGVEGIPPGFEGGPPGGFAPMSFPNRQPAARFQTVQFAPGGPGFPVEGGPPGGFPGGPPGGFPFGGQFGVPTGPTQETDISRLQFTLMLEQGVATASVPVDLQATQPDESGFRLFVIPVRDFRVTPGASGGVTRMILTSDVQDTFNLASAAMVVETGQITVSIRRAEDPPGTQTAQVTIKPGAISLVADVEAGAADPAVEWNFDADNVGNLPAPAPIGQPAAPPGFENPGAPGEGGVPGEIVAPPVGPRIDARGLVASFTYPDEEQNYRVEVTVRDRSGNKPPVTASILVRVRA